MVNLPRTLLGQALQDENPNGFGTFKGVYTPSILTILGVIMYLRMGWVLGNVGLIGTLVIVTISSAITFLTALSISATATNMKVGGGGAYYMISRSLGVEAGAAVGIPLFFAQALGISFYIVGFADSLTPLLPWMPDLVIRVATLVVLAGLAYFSADLALKIQFAVFLVIITSLIAFFYGASVMEPVASISAAGPESDVPFWTVFAVFFPAVTGIEAGLAMSGDLKNPARSLPLGTLAAVVTGYLIYLAIPIAMFSVIPQTKLLEDALVMKSVAIIPEIIFLGIWGATLSSALGALLGAPRTLQALSIDRVVPSFIGRGFGDENTPRIATLLSFAVALVGLLGDLNVIAPILSMFFLTSYGVLNFSAGIEEMIANPSWRPKFRIPWVISMVGAFGCFATMFMIDAGATFVAGFAIFVVYYIMQRRQMRAHWGDMRRGILMYLARYSMYRLADLAPNAKSWRPNLLVLSGSPTSRWYLIELSNAITHGKGFLTVATVIKDKDSVKRIPAIKKSVVDYLKKRDVTALVEVHHSADVMKGVYTLVQSYGMGSLTPNTILLGETEQTENFIQFSELLRFIFYSKRNVVVLREGVVLPKQAGTAKRIDVWWGRERQNAGLMLAMGYMLQNSPEWLGARLVLKSIVNTDEEKQAAIKALQDFVAAGRLDVDVEIIIRSGWKNDFHAEIRDSSKDANLIFMGMRPPDEDESAEDYSVYYRGLLKSTSGFPPTALVIAAENVDFANIFV